MKTFLSLFLTALLIIGFTARAQQFQNYTSANGLPSDNVLGVAVDATNQIWFGTQSGVARLSNSAWTVYTTANGLIDNYINCIAVDAQDHVWAGTDYGVSMFNGSTWTNYTTSNGLIDNMISRIAGAPDGSVWIGTQSGVSHYNGTTFTNYTTANGLPSDMISCIAADDNNVWFGTFIGGLSKFNGTTFTNYTMADSLPSENITAIALGNNGTKWIGTYSGVAVFNASDQWVTTYRQAQGLYNNFIQDITMDSRGTMWFAIYDPYTMDGAVTRYDDGFWSSFTTSNGLVNYLVKRIATDGSDNEWVATGSGVSKIYDIYLGTGEIQGTLSGLYPNPAGEVVHLDGVASAGQVEIRSTDGRKVFSSAVMAGSNTLPVNGLARGIYLVRCTTSAGTSTGKLVIR
ncbi:MAG TPA: two-component regulator propeller domain-containing protein [Bacteroidales bacterium]|nr:two-component regulator propeller domain-containing protein [Bacteroidales bacterium]